ncbi:hypothetical protein [Leptolyngbya sp. 7M]|uniref:hypothetical protein n=1 Tax=Leptolyngbya sp. 7M TaxID=2812896 RepID=UPI001B8D53FB|nr:hypothetical protein [Leptolyngbya sp. 7M]QYO61983.1 hypothetical protein JVX88_17805 [Leptolyngbya sp. 7M]
MCKDYRSLCGNATEDAGDNYSNLFVTFRSGDILTHGFPKAIHKSSDFVIERLGFYETLCTIGKYYKRISPSNYPDLHLHFLLELSPKNPRGVNSQRIE